MGGDRKGNGCKKDCEAVNPPGAKKTRENRIGFSLEYVIAFINPYSGK